MIGVDARSLRREAPSLLPGLAAVAVFLVWGAASGGYAPVDWYPGALYFLGLLVVVAIAYPSARADVGGAAVAAIGLLTAFAVWSYLSIAWADVQGEAWDGANRTLLYASVYALFVLLPWRTGAAVTVLGAHTIGTAAVGAVVLAQAVRADDALTFFTDGRFSDPVGYPNGNVALWLMAFWPAVFLAARRELAVLVRAPALAVAGLLLQLAVLGQSRGSIVAFPVALAAFVALVPGRLRSLLALAAVGAATLAAAEPLLDVYNATGGPDRLHDALVTAASAMAISFVVLLALGAAAALADRRIEIPERLTRRAGVAVAALGTAAGLVAVVIALAAVGNPATWLSDRWDEFKTSGTPAFEEGRFSLEAGSDRYDFWRVAVLAFREHPVTGIGAENYAVEYVRERRSHEEPLYAHSLELGLLAQTGLVGGLLAAGFLAAAAAAVLRVRRALDPFARAIAAAAVVPVVYWLVHGSLDWFWEIPALTAPALAWLGLAGGLARTASAGFEPRPRRAPRLAVAAGAAAALLAAVSYAPPWLAAREVEVAAAIWREHPTEAYDRLDRGRGLNRLSDRPDLIAGAIAARRDDREAMRAAFERALERNPHSWYAELELAILAAAAGNRDEALRRLDRAAELNPSEPALAIVRGRVRQGRQISPRLVDRMFLQRVEERTS